MGGVTYCDDSTITEAWAVVIGTPAPFDRDEQPAILHAARKRIEGLGEESSVITGVNITDPSKAVPPFWSRQVSWDKCFLTRFGHRYLGVHFQPGQGQKYETYEKSFLPGLEPWLEVYREFYTDSVIAHRAHRVGYGYVNTFRFPLEGFDLSENFKVSVGVGVASAKTGLTAMDLRFAIQESEGVPIRVQVTVGSDPSEPGQVIVITKVSADIVSDSRWYLDTPALILPDILRAKNIAKRVFFEMATEQTHGLMGAKYASE